MARREIEPDPNYGSGNFLRIKDLFQNIGDSFTGLYQEDSEGTYGQDYRFKQRSGEIGTLTVKGSLAQQLKKAHLQFGEKVTITFIGEKDVQQSSPMRLFKIAVDDGPKGQVKPAPKKPALKEETWGEEDVSF